ncbi:MAG: ribosylnicotinamide kinase [Geoglossum simile]|nr:MAG: ribosylnicotinamide kinase [Geoglossum simile]
MASVPSSPQPAPRAATIIGISGCSSSGKTTISRLLRSLFPNTSILHQDDFYRPDSQVPIHNGYQDWDCAESFDFIALRDALQHVRSTGTMPPDLVSKEDQNTVNLPHILDSTLSRLREHIASRLSSHPLGPIFLLDGILIYPPFLEPSPVPYLTVKLLLTVDLAMLVERRKRRKGYVTLEGFWEDPEGYVEEVVWKNWVRDHAFLAGGDELGIKVQPREGWSMEEVLEWVVGEVLEGLLGDSSSEGEVGGKKEEGERV